MQSALDTVSDENCRRFLHTQEKFNKGQITHNELLDEYMGKDLSYLQIEKVIDVEVCAYARDLNYISFFEQMCHYNDELKLSTYNLKKLKRVFTFKDIVYEMRRLNLEKHKTIKEEKQTSNKSKSSINESYFESDDKSKDEEKAQIDNRLNQLSSK